MTVYQIRRGGKVYPIHANSPEEAWTLSGQIPGAAEAPAAEESSILGRFASRTGFAGLSQVPGAIADVAGQGVVGGAKALAGGLAGTVGQYAGEFAPSAIASQYRHLRTQGDTPEGKAQGLVNMSPVGAAAGSIPLLGKTAEMISSDIVQGKVPEMAGDLLTMAPTAIGAMKGLGKPAASALEAGAEKSMQQALGATTKDLKGLSAKVAPELVKRGVVGLTRKSLAEKFRASIDVARTNLDEALAKVPESELVDLNKAYDAMDSLKSPHLMPTAAGEMVPANAVAANTIKAINSLQESLLELDPSYGSVRKFRQILDKQVTAGGRTFGRTIKEGTVLDVTRDGANVIRNVLSEARPDIAVLNKELSFWLNAKKIMETTLERTASQATPLGVTMAEGAGLAGSLASGGTVGKAAMTAKMAGAVKAITNSAGWKTAGALVKSRLARALMNQDPGEINAVASFVTKRPMILLPPQEQPN